MYAKIFTQILDSSLAEDYKTRHVFEDLLKLCDPDGVVDITHEAIARRTNVPLEIIRAAIEILEQPDPASRNPENDGRRLVRLDEHRTWGWIICNYSHYRNIAREEQRREKTRDRVARFKAKHQQKPDGNALLTLGNAPLTDGSATLHREKKREKHMEREKEGEGAAPLSSFQKPDLQTVQLLVAKVGLPDIEAEKFFNYYQGTGWKVGRNPMKDLSATIANWKIRWQERTTPQARQPKPAPTKF